MSVSLHLCLHLCLHRHGSLSLTFIAETPSEILNE